MKIAVLNRIFLSEKHKEELQTLGEVIFYNDTDTEEEVVARLNNVVIAVVDPFVTPLTKTVFEKVHDLKYIALSFTGYDPVDIDAAKSKGIQISNVPEYGSQSVAEHVFALMFAVIRKTSLGDRRMREKPFEIDIKKELHNQFVGFEIQGKTLGVFGYGKIGSRVAKIANSIGMVVISNTHHPTQDLNVRFVSFDELLNESDILSLNIPLNKETENIISWPQFEAMKTGSVLINTARGGLVDTDALYKALSKGQIWGAGLDVIDAPSNHPIFELNNVVFTPHSAFFTEESLKKLADTIVDNVRNFIQGHPINLLN